MGKSRGTKEAAVSETKDKPVIGWREWVALPELGITHIKAKVDTGARTSALHTFELETYHDKGAPMIRFKVHPRQGHQKPEVECHCQLLEQRWVADSGGHREERHVIVTELQIGLHHWPIEMTLTNRDSMKFRMLLGRTGMAEHFLVDPQLSYQLGPKPKRR